MIKAVIAIHGRLSQSFNWKSLCVAVSYPDRLWQYQRKFFPPFHLTPIFRDGIMETVSLRKMALLT